jgi:hypothetical protein
VHAEPSGHELTGLGDRTVRKVSRKLVPFLLLLYTLAYLDRVNVGFASLEMTRELRFSNEVYGFGAGIFFLGYWLLEIPGAVLVERWSARKWISRIMLTWGAAAAATGLVNTAGQFYTARFLLGVAEAGFFPGIAVYFTHWFPANERAKAFAGYMRIHALEASGGLTYSQMGRFATADGKPAGTNDPAAAVKGADGQPASNLARNTWVTETALATALNVSYMAEKTATFGIVVGIALLLAGFGFAILAIGGALRNPELGFGLSSRKRGAEAKEAIPAS